MSEHDRQAVRERLRESLNGGLLVLTAYDQTQLAQDMAHSFVQEGSFWWLTGIGEPGWKVIVDSGQHQITLVRPDTAEHTRLFDGSMSDATAREISGIQHIITSKEFETALRKHARKHTVAYTIYDTRSYDFAPNPAQKELHATISRIFTSVVDCQKTLAELRAIKTPQELRALRRAVALTCSAFEDVKSKLSSYRYEYEIEADFTHAFRRKNAHHAYEPIVASGHNALTLHYTANGDKLAKNKPVLIDIGARVEGYCADITRTYCVNPTKRQRQVHAAVQEAHRQIIALLGPNLLVSDYIQKVDATMKEALHSVGLLTAMNDDETYRKYFPHAITHGLGIDVHDSLGAPRYFKPGMVITVEPGIYIPEEGIGVRIEDDILITETGHVNLSASLSTNL